MIDLKNLKLEMEVEARLRRVEQPVPKTDRRIEATTQAFSVDQIPDILPVSSLLLTPPSNSPALREMLEPVGGAVPLDSGFYIRRPVQQHLE